MMPSRNDPAFGVTIMRYVEAVGSLSLTAAVLVLVAGVLTL